jgi:V-type H+-transporting ATPase subunit F
MDKGEGSLIGVIGDEDTVTGFLLAGVGNVDVRRNTNFLVVDGKTTKKAIEDAFKDFTTREDIAVVLINQTVADQIRYLVDEHTAPVPAVLEVPSKDAPYDATKDSILSRVQHLARGCGVGSSRRSRETAAATRRGAAVRLRRTKTSRHHDTYSTYTQTKKNVVHG